MGKRKGSPGDNKSVRIDERWEVGYWTTALTCSEAELRAALEAVGSQLGKLREHFTTIRAVALEGQASPPNGKSGS